MKIHTYILILSLTFTLVNCKQSTDKKNIELIDSTLLVDKKQTTNPAQSNQIENWKTDDFIINCPKNYRNELKTLIEHTKKEWKNVKNPFIATYKGNKIQDYFHINFEDNKVKTYDFGFGNNEYGDYILFDKANDYKDNPKYINQQFKISWEWKISTFPCCNGEYELVETYMPSIVKLELIPKNE